MTISVSKAMNALQDQGLIEGWKFESRYDDWRDVTETDVTVKSALLSVSNEVYGRKAMLYFRCTCRVTAEKVKDVLRSIGGKPNDGWYKEVETHFEVPVSYFRGRRWWE